MCPSTEEVKAAQEEAKPLSLKCAELTLKFWCHSLKDSQRIQSYRFASNGRTLKNPSLHPRDTASNTTSAGPSLFH
ncbi:hypothetical protein E2C01_030264 [Portunus trituberculatus]|uniref:Uncharacterized protein n=1 Tax=Portunus trituberculatus TaxID=210409 RepID=A0A5B7EUA4_PORTR|nr:hypothetical protein [Portunus trituberculatus]